MDNINPDILESADERFCIMTIDGGQSDDVALQYIKERYGDIYADIIRVKYKV